MESYFSLITLWTIFKNWWWLPLPFILYQPFLFLWLWYKRECYDRTVKKIVLEIKLPKEVIKPIKAMEQVFAGFHAIHDVFTWREKWLEGKFQYSLALEIVSIGGETHFFIRIPEGFRDIIESNIYSQYPEAEISEVRDYAKLVPQNIPNKDWDLFGFDMINTKEDAYPIKTYPKFEEPREAKEEKRIDPLAGLLDGMAVLKPGEQLWLQIIAKPVREEIPWKEEGRELADKLVRRPRKVTKPLLQEAADVLITGKPPGALPEKEEWIIPPEMKLTPGERRIVEAIEEKISKFCFTTNIRYIYLGKRDVFFKPKARIPYGFFKAISTEDMNGLKPWKKTMPKIQWILRKRRAHLRKRGLFRRYLFRVPPLFPRPGGTFLLNTEELATLYHFPGRTVAPAPSLPRVEAKKGEAPPGLPIE